MAIYHTNIKSFSRAKGESSIAAAAYRAGIDLVDTRTRVAHRYASRKGVVAFRQLAPAGAPAWATDPLVFWDTNEAGETRANARVAREVETSLPCELNSEQREALAVELGQMLVDRYRCAVLVAIHAPAGKGDTRNHHVHLLMSARQIGPDGLGARAGAEFEGRSGAGAEEVKRVREIVGRIINEHLARAGIEDQVDHRTLKAQAIEAEARGDTDRAKALRRIPTRHNGKVATALARKVATAKDEAAWDAAVAKARAAGTFVDSSPGHTHEAALADRLMASRPDPRDPEAFRSAWLGEEGWRPRSLADLQPSPMARHLSRVGHLARMRKEGAEAFHGVLQLVQSWTQSIRDQAQESIDRVKRYIAQPAEEFLAAAKSLMVRRVHVYGDRPHFFHDTEFLVRLVGDYSRALISPLVKEERFTKARDQAHVAKIMLGTQSAEFLEASRELWQAKRSISPQTKERDRKRTVAALRALTEAHAYFENSYQMSFADPVELTPDEQCTYDNDSTASEAAFELRPPTSPSGPFRFRSH